MTIHIARNGEVFGTFSLGELSDALAAGKIQASDLAWHEGLTDWCVVTDVISNLRSTDAQSEPTEDEPKSTFHTEGGERLATEKQIGFIRVLGGDPRPAITREQASDWIDRLLADPANRNKARAPEWEDVPLTEAQISFVREFGGNPDPKITKGQASRLIEALKTRENSMRQERQDQEQQAEWALAAQNPPHWLLLRIKRLEKQSGDELRKAERHSKETQQYLADCQVELKRLKEDSTDDLDEEEREEALSNVNDLKAEIAELEKEIRKVPAELRSIREDAREELKAAKAHRVNWWMTALCGDCDPDDWFDWAPDSVPNKALEYYSEFGAAFKRPTRKMVQTILDGLDDQVPNWDKEKPADYFFGTFFATFPDFKRSLEEMRRAVRKLEA